MIMNKKIIIIKETELLRVSVLPEVGGALAICNSSIGGEFGEEH